MFVVNAVHTDAILSERVPQQANTEPDTLPVGPDGSDVLIPAAGARQEVTRFHSAVLSHDGGEGRTSDVRPV